MYVDSNVFIYPVIYDEKSVKKAAAAKRVLVKIAEGTIDASTASLTWDELVWVARKILGKEIAEAEGKKFLEFPNLKILNVDERTIKEAQDIMEKYALKPRDSIHLGCAIRNRLRDVISDDPHLDAVDEAKRIRLEEV